MTQYVPNPGSLTATTLPKQVGTLYNVGLSDGTHYFGYIFQNQGTQSLGLQEKNDVNARDALTSYGSPNLVDRDLVFYPRVSQGDFSGGGLQQVLIDQTKFMFSDLSTSYPGAAKLRARWAPVSVGSQSGAIGNPLVCILGSSAFVSANIIGDTNFYKVNAGSVTTQATSFGAGPLQCMVTDGRFLYIAAPTEVWRFGPTGVGDPTVPFQVTAGLTEPPRWMRAITQGTDGRFLYYVGNTTATFYRLDLNNPPAESAIPQGGDSFDAWDCCEYENGVAVLTIGLTDQTAGSCDVWLLDANASHLTRIVNVEGYSPSGICNCQGNLYVGLHPILSTSSPLLARISGGTFEIVAQINPTEVIGTTSLMSRLVASGNFVYWINYNPSNQGVAATATPFIQYFDVTTGAIGQLPQDTIMTGEGAFVPPGFNQLDAYGAAVAYVNKGITGGNGFAALHVTGKLLSGLSTYQSSGWLVSSRLDFTTPGIAKRFRRVQVAHAPLTTGQSITVKAFVDSDPTKFTPTLTPVPTGATITNSTVGSSSTTLTFGVDTIGFTLYYAIQINAGATNTTTPTIWYTAVEVGGSWVWTLNLDCSKTRRMLSGATTDPQGINGKDLYYLIRNAYENGTNLTLYLAENVSYTVSIEGVQGNAVAYRDKGAGTPNGAVKADEEWLAQVVLRQVS